MTQFITPLRSSGLRNILQNTQKNEMKAESKDKNQEPDWEFFEYASRLEDEWKESLPRYTDKELFEIFPEARHVIPLKMHEWRRRRRKMIEIIKAKFRVIHTKSAPENQWFWKEVVKQFDGQDLIEANKHISRLRRQLAVAYNKKPSGNRLTEEHIQRALSVPLLDIAMQHIRLRRSGRTFKGLCPFHNERHSSFHVYPHNNSFYCFGCSKGGNVINFVRELQGLSFREAVQYLAG